MLLLSSYLAPPNLASVLRLFLTRYLLFSCLPFSFTCCVDARLILPTTLLYRALSGVLLVKFTPPPLPFPLSELSSPSFSPAEYALFSSARLPSQPQNAFLPSTSSSPIARWRRCSLDPLPQLPTGQRTLQMALLLLPSRSRWAREVRRYDIVRVKERGNGRRGQKGGGVAGEGWVG